MRLIATTQSAELSDSTISAHIAPRSVGIFPNGKIAQAGRLGSRTHAFGRRVFGSPPDMTGTNGFCLMDRTAPQEEVFALLADPATHGGAAVRRIDTHAAAV